MRLRRRSPVAGSKKCDSSPFTRKSSSSVSLRRSSVPSIDSTAVCGTYTPSTRRRPLRRSPRYSPVGSVLPVLRHPEPLVELRLAPVVLAPRADRRDFHHEGGHHPLLPQLVARAFVAGNTERDEHVRRHPGARIALLVVDEEIPGHVDVRAVPVMVLERADRIDDREELPVVLRHRLAVPARILNRGGRSNDSAHRKVPPCGATGTGRAGSCASRAPATIARSCPLPKRRSGAR